MQNFMQTTKLCPKCQEQKPLDCFYEKGKCKDCYKLYYQENKERYAERFQKCKKSLRKRENKIRERNRTLVQNIKNKTPCADCGVSYPHYMMDFDHLPHVEKIANISWLAGHSSWKIVQQEIAKCEVVCANCHRKRTWNRLKSQRQKEGLVVPAPLSAL
jgi:hypothetical protein